MVIKFTPDFNANHCLTSDQNFILLNVDDST